MLAYLTGLRPGRFVHMLGDAHVYQNHEDAVRRQLARTPRPFPRLVFARSAEEIGGIDGFVPSDFVLEDYQPAPMIRAPMAV
jgi:thymidylate synthase